MDVSRSGIVRKEDWIFCFMLFEILRGEIYCSGGGVLIFERDKSLLIGFSLILEILDDTFEVSCVFFNVFEIGRVSWRYAILWRWKDGGEFSTYPFFIRVILYVFTLLEN